MMENESFEDEATAALMNKLFVNIKVDREERPDLDAIYMDAVQAMTGQGGWPMSVWLTPEGKPFHGGTYYPKEPRYGMPGFQQVLRAVADAYQSRREQVDGQAERLTALLKRSTVLGAEDGDLGTDLLDEAIGQLLQSFDEEEGGFGSQPKFLQPMILDFALAYSSRTGDLDALHLAELTLEKMALGGIYDQLGGGFHRYSVDRFWLVPHFEKMLYDNGQLLSLYAEAYRLNPSPYFKTILTETVGWLSREMQNPEGGLYSALDADSEGIEGKYYLWTWREWHEALGTEAGLLAEYYQLEPEGNWEHGASILRPLASPEEFAKERNLDLAAFLTQLEKAKLVLLNRQRQRVRPGLDDKNLAGWNAMAATGLTDAALALGEQSWLDQAEQVMKFVSHNLMDGEKIFRSWKGKRSPTEGFLEDYAFVIAAFLKLYQGTGREIYLSRAERIAQYTLDHFQDPEDGYFFYTSSAAEELIARKKEIFDNVIPSSNAVMARNLLHLGIMLDRPAWVEMARRMVKGLQPIIRQEPVYMCHWGLLMAELAHGLAEVVIQGPACRKLFLEFQRHYKPYALWMMSTSGSSLPLFQNRNSPAGETRIHICYNHACQMPVTRVHDALPLFK
ncbi:MAG TPA: thioredoxin domain-containing protein [Cytophagales bacterium]|nr:thioredoxin domain-containing protein [Cytophagales bacterium]